MNDLRDKLSQRQYDIWLTAVMGSAQAVAIAQTVTANAAMEAGAASAPVTEGVGALVGGAVAASALAIVANAEAIYMMAGNELGRGTGTEETSASSPKSGEPEPNASSTSSTASKPGGSGATENCSGVYERTISKTKSPEAFRHLEENGSIRKKADGG